jgi:hypothetical protein
VQPRPGEIEPQDASQMSGRVLPHGELGAVPALNVRRPRTSCMIHTASLRRSAYARLQTETNAARR